ncbi:MAG: nickel pincer cofactor biosynthesis protein LarC [Synechococcales cyanobacterium]
MKLAYWECSAGIAGDMCLGSLLACGVPIDYLTHHLEQLIPGEFHLRAEPVQRGRQSAIHAVVEVVNYTPTGDHHHSHDHGHAHNHTHRHWAEIRTLLSDSSLPPRAKAMSLRVFTCLAQAEATVHAMPIDHVHFHEVGAVDAIVDVVGTCLGLDWLGIEKLVCSPHPMGGGVVHAAHGQMTVPVPAVVQLWETFQVPVFSNGIAAELVTPTGAALAVGLAQEFAALPPMRVLQVGRGAGTRELAIPNVLRLWVGESSGIPIEETITVLETQLDDVNPQIVAYACEQLLVLGAWDVYTQAITMKQGRPGILLTVICPPDLSSACQDLIFRETTTLGIRHQQQQRTLLTREFLKVETPYGPVSVKVARHRGQVMNMQPEFRDCVHLAQQTQSPVQEVWLAAQQQARVHLNSTNPLPD